MSVAISTTSPIIIAHRGASGYRPEHTLAAYELAMPAAGCAYALGADYIEPDLVSTKDGVLIARHENEISETTDVASHAEFAHLQTTKIIDGESKTGWFTEDFTLAELKTLRAKERIGQLRSQNTAYDGLFEIPTLQEIIDLVKRKSAEINRVIGIYPETKHPTYFKSIGLALEPPLLATLTANGYEGVNAPIFIQSFEVSNLQDLSTKTDLPLVQLLNNSGKPNDFVVSGDERTYADLATASGLREIAKYAQAVGIHKNLLVPRDSSGKLRLPTSLVTDAHTAGLLVHVWTFRNEDYFLPLDFQGNPQGEYELFFSLGVDGVFSDYPDTASNVKENLRFKPCSS
ncbi:glycerophosphodiester phosphodiesterase [Nostoc sp. UCD121]|uniref:glycerophosphodiester phosphodiesterase n=1 Tax=unclassified Nostoc TaxID=2593658 RepID=UPI001628C148|nr:MULTISPECIES: glycerophosphodiester phosphodiesterase [unclassified Nostoc]MBC1224378.1 glycerophosphodiester phosphodiesterase [Nostoc sp. UCD120]MBC1278825.1 glycerophosphodiester phosphodiesterase [Nostoc sp. UCD121]MBC1295051.1 glycerophosphodiester phosphodiesterase [Nostoc sp. UCD122]